MFGDKVDNSKLTPEFNQDNGQSQDTTDNNNQNIQQVGNDVAPIEGQAADNQEGGQNSGVADIVVGDETFASQEEMAQAYEDMKRQLATRDESYKKLQSAYTKSRQEIAMHKKIAKPQEDMGRNGYNNQMYNPYNSPNMMGDMYSPMAQYNNPMNQPYMYDQMAMPNYNAYYAQPQQAPQQQPTQVVNETMINMAVEGKLMELKASDTNFDEVASELWNVMENDEYFSKMTFVDPEQAKYAVGTAYQMAKQRVETAKANVKINNAKAEAYRSKQQKVLNNDNSAVANKGRTQPKKTDEELIRESITGAKPLRF